MKTEPFQKYMFTDQSLNIESLLWWKSQSSILNKETLKMVESLMSAVSSSAGVERVFSTFGLVHSKIRNRL